MRLEFITLLVAYIAIGTIIAVLSRKYGIKSIKDYYVAGGMLRGIFSAGTYAATTYSAFMMVGLVGMTYATGVGALGFELLYLMVTVFLLSTVGHKIWHLAKKRNWITPPQMLGDLYKSRLVSMTVAAVYLVAMIPYLAAQIQGLRVIFKYGGLNESLALAISAILTYVWIFVAGAWSVALTDLYQGVLALIGGIAYFAWVAAYLVPDFGLDLHEVIELLGNSGHLGITSFWKIHVFLAYTIPWIFFAITNPQVVMRLYMPKDEGSYKRMVVYFSVYGLLYTIIVTAVGLLAAGVALAGKIPLNLKWDEVTSLLLGSMNPLIGSLIAISIIGAAISTANSIVLAVSGAIVRDILSTGRIVIARFIDGFLVLVATLIAFQNVGFIVEMSVLTSIILLPLAPITLLGIYRGSSTSKVSRILCTLSILVGVLMSLSYSVIYGPRMAFTQPIMGLPLSVWTLLVSSIIALAGHTLDSVFSKRATSTPGSF